MSAYQLVLGQKGGYVVVHDWRWGSPSLPPRAYEVS
jgi:hypothetical protein